MITTLTINGEKITESDNMNVIANFAERKIREILFNIKKGEMDYNEIHTNVDINIY